MQSSRKDAHSFLGYICQVGFPAENQAYKLVRQFWPLRPSVYALDCAIRVRSGRQRTFSGVAPALTSSWTSGWLAGPWHSLAPVASGMAVAVAEHML